MASLIEQVAQSEDLEEAAARAAGRKERVVVTREGRPPVAVIPVEDLALLAELEDQQDAALIRERLAAWERNGRPTIPIEDVAREYGLKP